MLLEDIWQAETIYASAFVANASGVKLLKNVGEFQSLGRALTAARTMAIELFHGAPTDRPGKTVAVGVYKVPTHNPDVRRAQNIQFERVGKNWIATIDQYRFITSMGDYPTEEMANELEYDCVA